MECPNCITPWKCNGPHLEQMSDSIYKSIHGYFLIKNDRWIFTPVDKEFDLEDLDLEDLDTEEEDDDGEDA